MRMLVGALLGALSLFAAEFVPFPPSPEGASYAREHVLAGRPDSDKAQQPRAFVTAADRILPGIMSGKALRSTITIVNLNSYRAGLSIYFLRYNGQDLNLPVIDTGTISGGHLTLDPFQRIEIGIDFSNLGVEGYALIQTDAVDDMFGSYSTMRSKIDGYADLQVTLPVMQSFDRR